MNFHIDFQHPVFVIINSKLRTDMQSNIFIDTISRFRKNTTVQELITDFKDQVKLKIFKRNTLQPQALIRKYHNIQRKSAKEQSPETSEEWQENERKVFLWFILSYSRLNFKKLSEITSKEWKQISDAFGKKNILLMKYQSRSLERNPQRVRWSSEEETLLKNCILGRLNGKWSEISRVIFNKTDGEHYKTAKQCRQHWFNHLNSNIRRGQWTIDEDLIILGLVFKEGHHWSMIVQHLSNNRTEHMVKNRFSSLLTCAKKLMGSLQHSEPLLITTLITQLSRHKPQLEQQQDEDFEGIQKEGSQSDQDSVVKRQQQQNNYEYQITENQNQKRREAKVEITKQKGNSPSLAQVGTGRPEISVLFKKHEQFQGEERNISLSLLECTPTWPSPYMHFPISHCYPYPLGLQPRDYSAIQYVGKQRSSCTNSFAWSRQGELGPNAEVVRERGVKVFEEKPNIKQEYQN